MKPKGVTKGYSTTGAKVLTPVGKRKGNRVKGGSIQDMKKLEMTRKAVKMRLKGHTYDEIGIEMGISCITANKLVVDEFNAQREGLKEDLEVMRQLELTRLDTLYMAATEPLEQKDIVVEHPLTGAAQTLKPDKQEAVKTALKVQERRAKLLGLDSGGKFDSDGDAPIRVYIGVDIDTV